MQDEICPQTKSVTGPPRSHLFMLRRQPWREKAGGCLVQQLGIILLFAALAVAAECGNGIQEAAESCEDGNKVSFLQIPARA